MLPLGFHRREENLGVCFMAACPHCLTMSEFTLRQMKGGLHLFGFNLFDFDRTHHVACSTCRFKQHIDEGEVPVAMAARDLYRRYSERQIDGAKYVETMRELAFPTLSSLQQAAEAWRCRVCGEAVPFTLAACWKCTTPRPPDVPVETPV